MQGRLDSRINALRASHKCVKMPSAIKDGNRGVPELSADPTVAGRFPWPYFQHHTAATRHVNTTGGT